MDTKEIKMNRSHFKQFLFLFFIGCYPFFSNAQKVLFETRVRSLNLEGNYESAFPFYNKDTKTTAVFLTEKAKHTIDLQLFSENKQSFRLIRGKDSGLAMPALSGVMYSDSIYSVYFLNRRGKGNRVGITNFNLPTNSVTNQTVELELKNNEKILTYFEYNNRFFYLSIEKETSIVNFHIFKNNEFLEKKKVVLNDEDFPHFLKDNLYNCIAYNKGKHKPVDVFNPLYAGKEEDYFFTKNGTLTIVVNTNRVLQINLKNFSHKVTHIPINYKENNESYKKSLLKNVIKQNRSQSTICDQYFFRINLVENTIQLQVYNLENGNQVLDQIIDEDHLNYKVVYNTNYSRELDSDMKANLLFMALQTGDFGFRVVKGKDDYHIHLGKVASRGFWEIFEDNTIPNKTNTRFKFDQKFVGVFADYKGKKHHSNTLSPFFVNKKIQSRYFDIGFHIEKGILPVTKIEKDKGLNPIVTFTDLIQSPFFSFKLNGFFRRENQFNFMYYDPRVSQLKIYKIND